MQQKEMQQNSESDNTHLCFDTTRDGDMKCFSLSLHLCISVSLFRHYSGRSTMVHLPLAYK
jgi:hypothetical protein